MKIKISKDELNTKLEQVYKVVSNKSPKQILECVLIIADNNKIFFIGNNLELAIKSKVNGIIITSGIAAVNAKLFTSIVNKLKGLEVNISVENDSMLIKCGKSKFTLGCSNAAEYPDFPIYEDVESIEILRNDFISGIRDTVFAASKHVEDKIKSSENIIIQNNLLIFTALDGHRISQKAIKLNKDYKNYNFMINAKILKDIQKILMCGNADKLYIQISEKHIIFTHGDVLILSRQIDGKYYSVNKYINNETSTSVRLNQNTFMDSLERATILFDEKTKLPIKLQIQEKNMKISINDKKGAKLDDLLDIELKGNGIDICFNPLFLLEAIKAIEEEEIRINFSDNKAPFIIQDEEKTYTHVVLPVNTIKEAS